MKKILPLVFCFLLAACGFQLRGTATLPFETLYIASPAGHPLGTDLKRLIRSGTNARIVDKAKDAEAILEIISVTNNRQIMSVSGGGRVREFELLYRVSFRLTNAKGTELIPTNEIVLHRILPYTDAQVVAKEGEEAMLVREMQGDSAAQIVRRLSAVKAAGFYDSPRRIAGARLL
jgi:LPS-assembly lipoprotein